MGAFKKQGYKILILYHWTILKKSILAVLIFMMIYIKKRLKAI